MKQLNWYQIFGNTHIIPDGKTVTPTDDIQTLLHCANIWDKSYTTLEEVLADDDTLFLICISDNAIDYMVRSTTWAANLALVPTMTSNTTPSGESSTNSQYSSSYAAFKAFDSDASTQWVAMTSAGAGTYIRYRFPEPVICTSARLKHYNNSVTHPKYKIQASNDGNTWTDVTDEITASTVDAAEETVGINTSTPYSYYQIYYTYKTSSSAVGLTTLQFYSASITASESAMQYIGASDYASETLLSDSTWLSAIDGSAYKDYVINASVPTMTSDTAPYGTAFAYGELSGYEAYKAFDNNDTTLWQGRPGALVGTIGYCFVNPVKVAQVKYRDKYGSKQVTLSHSDNGTDYTVASESATITSGETNYYFSPSSLSSHRYWRVNITATESSYFYVETLQFSGRQNAGVQSWLKAGGVEGKKYTTVSEVLSDLTTLATLMASSDAIDYLVTAKGWATEICSDSNAMADIGMNNYAANTLLADETWAEAIGNSDYVESVMNIKVPAMTSNTQPYGTCIRRSSGSSTLEAWKAFDGGSFDSYDDSSAYFSVENVANEYLGYIFLAACKIRFCKVALTSNSTDARTDTVKVQASNDSFTTPVDMSDSINVRVQRPNISKLVVMLDTTNSYSGFRLLRTSSLGRFSVQEMQFYGRKDI